MSAAISRNRSRAEGIERSRIQWPSQNPSTTRWPEITRRGSTWIGSPDKRSVEQEPAVGAPATERRRSRSHRRRGRRRSGRPRRR